MRGSAPEITREDGQLRVEARSAAAALAAVTEELGTSARIIAVDRVVRGGIAGFFSRELIQVTADPGVERPGGVPARELPLGQPSTEVVEQTATVVREHLERRRAATAAGGAPVDGPAWGDGAAVAAVSADTAPQAASHTSSFADVLREATLHPSAEARAADAYARPQPIEVPQRRTPEMVGSPVAIALDRLLKGVGDSDNFGEALRRELQRTGWEPRHGSPATSRVRRVWTGPEATAGTQTTDATPAPDVHGDPVVVLPNAVAGALPGADPWDLVPDPVAAGIIGAAGGSAAGDARQAGVPDAPAVADADAAPDGQAPVALTVAALRQLGVPPDVLDAVDGLPTDARGAWVAAVAGCVAPWCSPPPLGDCVFVGPDAGRFVAGTDVPVASMDGPLRASGDIAVAADDSRRGRGDVEWLRDGRWLHLVVGGGSWRWHLMSEPQAVSWADAHDLPAALTVAARHGIALGERPAAAGHRATADPEQIAEALITLVEQTAADAR